MKILSNNIAVIEGDTHISKWVEESGRLDHDQAALSQILPHIKEGDHVLDIGAFIGDHTIAYINAVGDSGKVYAFEPNLRAFECLDYNCKKALRYDLGVSDKSGTAPFIDEENVGASWVDPRFAEPEAQKVIWLQTIDQWDLQRVDFIKMDIEGFEIKGLNGGRKTIEKFKPVMWIEVNRPALERNGSTPEELEALVESFGYSVTPWPHRGEQYDILCLPKQV